MRARSYAHSTLLQRSQALEHAIGRKYGAGRARPLVLDAAGCHTKATVTALSRVESTFPDEEAADRMRLTVAIGAACVQAEASSFAEYTAAVEQARALAGADGTAWGRERSGRGHGGEP